MDIKKSGDKVKTVEINIAVPSLAALRSRMKTSKKLPRPSRKTLAIGGIVGAIVIIASGGYYLASHRPAAVTNGSQTSIPTAKLQHGTPDYPTVLPVGKTIEDLGGWTRVSPPNANPVFAYVDHIGNTQINVSQQPLPEEFKSDTQQQTEQLAGGYKANEKIAVGDIPVHIGTSAKGPQSVIFNKDNLLVLIKSTAQLDNNQWAMYINSLK